MQRNSTAGRENIMHFHCYPVSLSLAGAVEFCACFLEGEREQVNAQPAYGRLIVLGDVPERKRQTDTWMVKQKEVYYFVIRGVSGSN